MTTVIAAIVDVWEAIMSALVGLVDTAQGMFWSADTNTLTFLGTLSVIGVAIGFILLVVGIIQNFLHLRG